MSASADGHSRHPCFDVLSHTGQYALLSFANSKASDQAAQYATAPIVTAPVLDKFDSASLLPELGLFGSVTEQHGASLLSFSTFEPGLDPSWHVDDDTAAQSLDKRVFLNLNTPFSAVLTGVQGSGKSHCLSIMLESALITSPSIGSLPAPLSCIVFHFDSALGSGQARPCEAAYVSRLTKSMTGYCTPPSVTVLVSPNCIESMKKIYAGLPVVVEPFQLGGQDMTANRLLNLMNVEEGKGAPLYMSAVLATLRSMGVDKFDYWNFKKNVADLKLNGDQREMLNLRLSLLDSFVKPQATKGLKSYFGPGNLVIIDLSDPFLDSASACGLFQIAQSIFVETDKKRSTCGKMVVLDEAHKYLDAKSAGSTRLTEDLLSLIRQQRHLGCRFVISTQEPTVCPSQILDLCSIIVAFRFSSPVWAGHLARHVCTGKDVDSDEWFSKIVDLDPGEAILFAPAGLTIGNTNTDGDMNVVRLGRGYLTVRTRQRITLDGGASIMAASPQPATSKTAVPQLATSKTAVPQPAKAKPPQPSTLPTKGPSGQKEARREQPALDQNGKADTSTTRTEHTRTLLSALSVRNADADADADEDQEPNHSGSASSSSSQEPTLIVTRAIRPLPKRTTSNTTDDTRGQQNPTTDDTRGRQNPTTDDTRGQQTPKHQTKKNLDFKLNILAAMPKEKEDESDDPVGWD